MGVRFSIFSDLHLEFSPWHVDVPMDTDVIVNAGDTHPDHRVRYELKKRVRVIAPNAEYVEALGNHDYYHGSFPDFPQEGQSITSVGGLLVAACTLWTGFDPGMWDHFADSMADARLIRGISYHKMAEKHSADLKFLLESRADVFVTHHSPSTRGARRFAGSTENPFFHNSLERIIENMDKPPRLWVHGHSHEPVDYKIGETRVVSNPRGYPREECHNRFSTFTLVVDT